MLETISENCGVFDNEVVLNLVNDYPSNWVTFNISHEGKRYHCEAKLFAEPSGFGINEGRISKFCVKEYTDSGDKGETLYAFDRGLDFDDLPEGVLDKILEAFPV